MLIALASLMAVVAFVVLVRLLWLSTGPAKSGSLIAIAAAALVVGLGVLAATGRLHWLAALGAALAPFVRRLPSLIRYLPWLGGLYKAYKTGGGQQQGSGDHAGGAGTASGEMTSTQAKEVLDLGPQPSKDEVIHAHRRLMQKIHPDRGGSTYFAQQLNEAKRSC